MSSQFDVSQEINRFTLEIEGQLGSMTEILEDISQIRHKLADQSELSREHLDALEAAGREARVLASQVLSLHGSISGAGKSVSNLSDLISSRVQLVMEASTQVSTQMGALESVIKGVPAEMEIQIGRHVAEVADQIRRLVGALGDVQNGIVESLADFTRGIEDSSDKFEEVLERKSAELVERISDRLGTSVELLDSARVRVELTLREQLGPAVEKVIKLADTSVNALETLNSRLDVAFSEGIRRGSESLALVENEFKARIEDSSESVAQMRSMLEDTENIARLTALLESNSRMTADLVEIEREIRETLKFRQAPVGHRLSMAVLSGSVCFALARLGMGIDLNKSLALVIPPALMAVWAEPMVASLFRSRH